MCPAEREQRANLSQRCRLTNEVAVPESIGRIAEEDDPGETAVAHDQLAIAASAFIFQDDGLRTLTLEIAHGIDRHAGYLEAGRHERAFISRGPSRQVTCQGFGLLVRRFDNAVAGSAMLGAFADRINSRPIGLELVVDFDAAANLDAPAFCKRRFRAYACGHYDETGGK